MPAKKKETSKEDIVLAALALAEELGWEHVMLSDIAERAGLSMAELHDQIEDKFDILAAFGRMIDRRVLEAMDDIEPEASTRDRLFDILMERYEILNDYRPGLLAVLGSFRYDPKQAVISLPHLCRSMSWMLDAAGADTSGIKGALKVSGLTGVYLKVLKTWVNDDSPDLGKVMAALDKDLGRVESVANSFGF